MNVATPETIEQLQELMKTAQSARTRIEIAGNRSKARQGGPVQDGLLLFQTNKLNRVLAYDPRDLTVSVEAGMRWRELESLLAEKRQMVALNPPFAEATVGGVLAANSSGSWRRLNGTARDLTIGMRFVTLEGKVIESGGMVVKNVAGLDFAKLMTGSFGTLAAIATVNFKLTPKPPEFAVFVFAGSVSSVFAERNRLLQSVLQPWAVDVLNPAAAARLNLAREWTLVVEAAGSPAVIGRYRRELAAYHEAPAEISLALRDFTPGYLNQYPNGHVLRLSTRLQEMEGALTTFGEQAVIVARAGSGVSYVHTPELLTLPENRKGVVDFSPNPKPDSSVLWPRPGNDFFLLERIKKLLDPDTLLNPGRLYGRI
jgi:glycolate oxidase FAD binding subunit